MIFAGDIAVPNKKSIPKLDIPYYLKDKNWFANLEGGLVNNIESEQFILEHKVFNNTSAFKEIISNINIKGLALANNHITDTNSIADTKKTLTQLGVKSVGAGCDEVDAKKSISINDDGVDVEILNFGWRSINCIEAGANSEGVNSLNRKNVISQVEEVVRLNKSKKIVVFFHWNYELELYPQPYERDLAHKLIDTGVSVIVGCHSHRVQGFEIYKNKPIIYGLGNFIFCQNKFWGSRLSYPDFCSEQFCVEINFKKDIFTCHWLVYEKNKNMVRYVKSENIKKSTRLNSISSFSNLTSASYVKWFRKNRIQKKMLPIFKYSDNKAILSLKNYWISLRHFLIIKIKILFNEI